MRNWGAMSNSSPVEGLEAALRTYARQDRKIAIYIFGDDFSGASYDRVLGTLRELNVDPATGRTRVRVHAVGFVSSQIHDRYATLMREVTRNHDGAFLALPVGGLEARTGESRGPARGSHPSQVGIRPAALASR